MIMKNKEVQQKRNIIPIDEIKRHLTELYQLQIAVNLCVEEKVELPGASLIYIRETDTGLTVKTRTVFIHGQPDIEIIYSHLGKACRFSSRIISIEETTSHYSFYKIEIPELIAMIDRRTYLRVTPSEGEKIYVEFSSAEIGSVNFPVLDISGGGVAFLVPAEFSALQKDTSPSLSLSFPDKRTLVFDALVIDTSNYLKHKRVGVTFINISEIDRAAITRFVFQKQMEAKQATDTAVKIADNGVTIALICEADTARYHFLKERNNLRVIKHLTSQNEISRMAPDIVILDVENGNSLQFLDMVKAAQATNFFPILIVGNDPKALVTTSEFITYSPPPFRENFIVQILRTMVFKSRLFTTCEKIQWRNPNRRETRVLVVGRSESMENSQVQSMENQGFGVILLEDKDGIISRIIDSRPDIIIMDDRFEKTDIFSLCRIMNINKKLRRIPKVLLTDDIKNVEDLFNESIIANTLVRPFTTNELIVKIKNALCK